MSKAKADLQALLTKMEKDYGKGALTTLGGGEIQKVDVIKTGSIAMDIASGIGGWPRGRISEVYGWPSSGKSTLMLHAVAECQKEGGTAAYIDVEYAVDPHYARSIGVDLDALLFSQPDSAEQALEIVDDLVCSGQVDLIVVDSVAALTPNAEIQGEMGDAQVGLQARLMSKAMRKLVTNVSRSNTCLIFVNQMRAKIGGHGPGDQTTTSGGNALPFAASVRVKVARKGTVKQGEEAIANTTIVKFVKNKMATPYKETEFDIDFGIGISKYGEVIDYAVEYDIAQKSGAWYNYGTQRLGQGRENAKTFLEKNQEIYEEILAKVMEKLAE